MAYFNTETRNLKKEVQPLMSWAKNVLLLSRSYLGTWKVQFRRGRPTVFSTDHRYFGPRTKSSLIYHAIWQCL